MLHDASVTLTEVYRAVDLVGVLCNGIIGGRIARQKRFDYVGFVILALMSALGGGAVRDVLLNTVPVALTDPYYLGTALIGALIAFLWKMDSKWSSRVITGADGLTLGCWTATGVLKTLSLGFGVLPAIMMGLTTGIGGGMIRDISAGNVPKILQRDTIYFTPALVSCFMMVGFVRAGQPVIGMGCCIVCTIVIIVCAQWKKWTLPEAPEFTITMTSAQLRQLLRLRGIQVRKDRVLVSDTVPEKAQMIVEDCTGRKVELEQAVEIEKRETGDASSLMGDGLESKVCEDVTEQACEDVAEGSGVGNGEGCGTQQTMTYPQSKVLRCVYSDK